MACTDCPDLIVSTIAAEVQGTLDKVRRIKYVTESFNRLLAQIGDKVLDDLNTLVDLIPDPPTLDISDIIDYFLCPLTPIALEIDPSLLANMDPRLVAVRLRRIVKNMTAEVIRLYNEALRLLKSYDIVKIMQRYVAEIYRAMGDAFEFIAEYPINAGRALTVKVLCPDIYESNRWPFKALVTELSNWSFDGIVPSGLDERAASSVRLVAAAEAKLLQWKTLCTVVV